MAMAGKQAKTLTKQQLAAALRRAGRGRYPVRDRAMVLLSVKAGLRAGEIAKLTWPMVLDSQGRISGYIALHDAAAKKRSGRRPLHLKAGGSYVKCSSPPGIARSSIPRVIWTATPRQA